MVTKRKKPGTLEQVGDTVKKAATTLVEKADQYVVEPVGKALGLSGEKTSRLSKERRKSLKRSAKQVTIPTSSIKLRKFI